MIFFRSPQRSKRARARDGRPMLASSAVRRQRRHSGLTGKQSRRIKNEHRRNRKGIDKSNIHIGRKPTRRDIAARHKKATRQGWW